MKDLRTIESKINEYIIFGADTDYRGNIPKGCTLTWDDYNFIEELISETIMFNNGLLDQNLKEKYEVKINSLHTNLDLSDLIKLLLSVK